MPLTSDIFTNPPDPKLANCANVSSAATHISQTENYQGIHVSKIQTALRMLAETEPALAAFTNRAGFDLDFAQKKYGAATADAVLQYKQSRNLIDRRRQPKADNIVGKMTIEWLDGEMKALQGNDNPNVDPHPNVVPPSEQKHMKWSISAGFSLLASIGIGQVGIALFKFRNDETGEERQFLSPQFGVGISLEQFVKWLKFLRDGQKIGIEAFNIAQKIALEAIRKNPRAFANVFEVRKIAIEIGKTILRSGSLSLPFTSFTKCEVFLPLTFRMLNEKNIGAAFATGGKQLARIHVSGKVLFTDKAGKMFGDHDLLSADTSGWVLAAPGVAIGGGVLLQL